MARSFGLLLPLFLLVCSGCSGSDASEDGSSDDEQALAASTSLDLDSAEMNALASGDGIIGCTQNVGEATLCAHPRGVVVLSDDGVALIEARNDDVRAAALSSDQREASDVDDVLGSLAPASAGAESDVQPQGLADGLARALFRAAAALESRGTARAAVSIARQDGEIAARRAPDVASELTQLVGTLKAGEFAARAESGALVVGGTSRSIAKNNAKRWLKLTHRRTIGVAFGAPGAVTNDAAIEAFRLHVRAAKSTLAPGERLAILVADVTGNFPGFVRLATEEGVDLVSVGNVSAKATAAIKVGDRTSMVDVEGLIRDLSERLFQVTGDLAWPM